MLCIYVTSCTSVEGQGMKLDEYIDMTLEQVIQELGSPSLMGEKYIDSNYLPTPIEPIYSAYFSPSELEEGITIMAARWVLKNNVHVLIWLEQKDEGWVVFSSLQYQQRKNVEIG